MATTTMAMATSVVPTPTPAPRLRLEAVTVASTTRAIATSSSTREANESAGKSTTTTTTTTRSVLPAIVTPASVPSIVRSYHILWCAYADLAQHQWVTGQYAWCHCADTPPSNHSRSSSGGASSPRRGDAAAVASTAASAPLLVRLWPHSSIAPSTAKLQLLYKPSNASPALQRGAYVTLSPIRDSIAPATSIHLTLRHLASTDGNDNAADSSSSSTSSSQSSRSSTAATTLSPYHDALLTFLRQGMLHTVHYAPSEILFALLGMRFAARITRVVASSTNRPPRSTSSTSNPNDNDDAISAASSSSSLLPSPPDLVLVTSHTTIDIRSRSAPSDVDDDVVSSSSSSTSSSSSSASSSSSPTITFDDIGGLADELRSVREIVELPLLRPELFSQFGVRPPRGVLLFGPPGTGKTLIARAIASQAFARFFIVNGPDIVSKYVGESEAKLRAIFASAQAAAPSIIFMDEIDSLSPSRTDATDALSHRIVSTLLTLMDGMRSSERVVVVAATNRPDSLDPALRRPGRFDREIEIGIPNEPKRLDILRRMLLGVPHALDEQALRHVASVTHGYVGADLKALCRESAMNALLRSRRRVAAPSSTPAPLASTTHPLAIEYEDVQRALNQVRPSSMREVLIEVPKVRWSDIGGQAAVKQRLKEAIEWPLQNPHAFERLGIHAPKGILLYGPPGCSKTLMAKALANESSRNFIAIKGPELFSKWVGESEKAVKEVFRKARAAAPSIVFFDEIDSVATRRAEQGEQGERVAERVLSQLLVELDGIEPLRQVTVLAATNRPDVLDRALLRPGRIDRMLYVAPPDREGTEAILRLELARMHHDPSLTAEALTQLIVDHHASPASSWYVYSGAELSGLCREAALLALEACPDMPCVAYEHFARALERTPPRLTRDVMAYYERYTQAQA